MNNLAAQLALDDSAMGEEIHEAQEGDGDEEGEEGGEVGVHELSCDEFTVLTQNAVFQRGNPQSKIESSIPVS